MQRTIEDVLIAIEQGKQVRVQSGSNLKNANLRNIDFSNAYLRNVDLSKVDLRNANLRGADLRSVDLSDTNLRGANLSDVDLSNAYLRNVDLSKVDLRNANLRGADLRSVDLSDANLCGANLCGADLSNANLRSAILSKANLSDANLCCANLRSVDLSNASLHGAKNIDPLIAAHLLVCPETGSFIAYKKLSYGCIAMLEIPADALRSSATSRKCRANKAIVLKIWNKEGNEISESTSQREQSFIYKVGETVYPDFFDENRWNESSNGIHFFITKAEAKNY